MATDSSVRAVAERLEKAYGGMDNRQVAAVLRERAGYETSYESVRRARKGMGQTIPHELLTATATAFDADVRWLLTGDGGAEDNHARMRERVMRGGAGNVGLYSLPHK